LITGLVVGGTNYGTGTRGKEIVIGTPGGRKETIAGEKINVLDREGTKKIKEEDEVLGRIGDAIKIRG